MSGTLAMRAFIEPSVQEGRERTAGTSVNVQADYSQAKWTESTYCIAQNKLIIIN